MLGHENFTVFDDPRPRQRINATFDVKSEQFDYQVHALGYETSSRDGSQKYLIEGDRFAYIQTAPYDRWEEFSSKFFNFAWPVVEGLGIQEFSRVGVRFINRLDTPMENRIVADAGVYLNVSVGGPSGDSDIVKEFHTKVVKQTIKPNILYGLTVASVESPLPMHGGILLDIDAFFEGVLSADRAKLNHVLSELRSQKNNIFEECITDRARELFGGWEE